METIVQTVLAHGQETPDKLALALKAQQVTYGQLSRHIVTVAGRLQKEYGIQKGDLVMISAVSKPEYVIAMLAVQYLNAVSVPVDKSAKPGTLHDLGAFIRPKLVLTDAKLDDPGLHKASLRELCAAAEDPDVLPYQQPDEEDLSELLFTTGTTGKPKGVMLTYGIIYANTLNTWKNIGITGEDRILLPLPLNHSFGLRVLRAALCVGASVILQNGFVFAKDLEANINAYHCTGMASAPASMEMLHRQMGEQFAQSLGNLRYIEISAGSLPVDRKRELLQQLPNVRLYNTWGSSETGGAVFLDCTAHPDKLDTIGRPAEGIAFKAVDAEGRTVQAHDLNTAGRMALQGPMQMAGYYHMPEITAETLVDGWLLTNDMVYMDDDGFVHMLGRADDIINVGGEKVSPIEVENAAQEFDEVRECACIGVEDPDGLLGWVPVLYVVQEGPGFHKDQLARFLSERLERYKLPQRVIPLYHLPRNRMQKVDRNALKELWRKNGDQELMNETILTILNRRSVREFTDKPVPKALLDVILQAGIYAPSGHNMQTWQFTVLREPDQIQKLKEPMGRVAKKKRVHFYGFNNPTTVVLVSNDRRNADGIQDSSCAAQNIMLAAHSFGVGSVWINALMTICDEPEIRALLRGYGIPDTHIVWAAIVMGWPAEPGKLLAKKQNVIKYL
mgnify:CR=1 FL=1